jgi:hypothetical protein
MTHYRKIRNQADIAALQQDLDEVLTWCNRWQMKLNLDKCQTMHVSSRRQPEEHDYTLSSKVLSKVSSYKYLGLHISKDLNWNQHVNSVISKANKILYVTKVALGRSTTDVKVAAYKTIVRPTVEYSSSVWDPYCICLSKIVLLFFVSFPQNLFDHFDKDPRPS